MWTGDYKNRPFYSRSHNRAAISSHKAPQIHFKFNTYSKKSVSNQVELPIHGYIVVIYTNAIYVVNVRLGSNTCAFTSGLHPDFCCRIFNEPALIPQGIFVTDTRQREFFSANEQCRTCHVALLFLLQSNGTNSVKTHQKS